MRAREFVVEVKACGDCFKVAGRNMIDDPPPELTLVHAYVTGQGPVKGKRFSHAWNEIGDVVIDYSNGKKVVMRKGQYYALGNIVQEPGQFQRYTQEQALENMAKYRHWGPWDLDNQYEKI